MARIRLDGQLLGAGETTVHTVNTNVQATGIELCVLNTDSTTSYGITIWFVPQGQSTATGYKLVATQANNYIRPGELRIYKFDLPFLDAGDFIVAQPSSASKLNISGGVLEEATS